MTWRGASSSGILQYSGGGIMTRWELSNPEMDKNTYTFTMRGSGAIGRAASTS